MIKNKAQITLFVVVGIVIAVVLVTFYYISGEVGKTEIAPGLKISVEKLPTEFQPVANYVESCIKSVGTNALQRIGQTGGFDEVINQNPLIPTESSSVELLPGSGINVAYWYHLKDSNECTTCMLGFDMPKLYKKDGTPSIETEIGKYIGKNLNECLNNFEVFSNQGIKVIPQGNITTEISVTDDYVVFIINYPLKLQSGSTETTATKFYSAVPLKLKKMYELASYVTGLEASNSFIEKDVLNLIVGFSGVDEGKLPPMADLRFGHGNKVRWVKSKVKSDIKDMLAYVSALQVQGTRNYEEINVNNDLADALYNRGMLIPSDGSFSDFEVTFDYIGWEPYFNLNCKGQICEPEAMSFSLLQIFGIQNYNFVYDLSFPVLVTVYDPEALTDEGYTFQFMLEGNIRSNEPLKANFTLIEAISMEESMFCDFDKRNSGIIKINITSPDNLGLDNVQVAYSCAGQDCYIGETKKGILEAKFPICLGGIVSFSKENYLGSYQYLDTEVDESSSINVVLEPIRNRKFVIKKKMIEKLGGSFMGQFVGAWQPTLREEELSENEEAVITLTRKGSLHDESYATTAMIKGPEEGDISLYSGEYDIEVTVISREGLVIPEREESAGFLFWGEDYTIPKVEFNETDPYISGGLKMDFKFTKDDLDNDVIVFYVVGIDYQGVDEANRFIEDLEEMNKIEDYSIAYWGRLLPRFE